ncbi:MAG: hypothetical protein CMB68_00195 [Euryarchaeota archaeon]|nr:hypothetical protein [Euryarchaeota archaeon]|tara:strand:- start:9760 stop:10089 length:330 start_codon:yes stop_codon:yes gene_type:complete
MSGTSEIEQYQRWLQARLAMSDNIEDPSERDRIKIQIESAIQLAIQYRQILEDQSETVPSPFTELSSPVRVVEDTNLEKSDVPDSTICSGCQEPVSGDLDFCPACGKYR